MNETDSLIDSLPSNVEVVLPRKQFMLSRRIKFQLSWLLSHYLVLKTLVSETTFSKGVKIIRLHIMLNKTVERSTIRREKAYKALLSCLKRHSDNIINSNLRKTRCFLHVIRRWSLVSFEQQEDKIYDWEYIVGYAKKKKQKHNIRS